LKDRVREVFLIGAAADRMAEELSGDVELIRAGNLESAVRGAFQRARPGDVILLAPACSSFDQFQDYEHRGRVFKELVERLAQDAESGAVEWKWKAESLAASSQEASEASGEPPAETLAPEVEIPHLAPVSPAPVRGKVKDELTLVYEISADELPPAEVELAQDYSEPPETSRPQAPLAPERIDDARLPYEARGDESGDAAGGAGVSDFAESGAKDMSGSSERSATIADSREPNSVAPEAAPQPGLPGAD
jgi:UDP-N-acetylmuramoylalanine--D-glutamate ligase